MALHKITFDSTSAAGRAATHQIGAVLYDSVNDRLGLINASQELLVKDTDIKTALDLLTHAEDSAHVSGDSGLLGLAVRHDAGGSLAGTDGDYAPLQLSASNELSQPYRYTYCRMSIESFLCQHSFPM